MNLPEGSPVEVRYFVTSEFFLTPLCCMYIIVYIYKYI